MVSQKHVARQWVVNMKTMNLTKILTVLAILISGLQAQAWTLNTSVGPDPKSGQLVEAIQLSCASDESLCTRTCNNPRSCYKLQEVCYNCLGTSNPLMRTLFTELNQYYRNTGALVPDSELPNVFKSKHIFIAAKSIFNFYTTVQNDDVAKRFKALCPRGSMNPIVVLETNAVREVSSIKYVICDPMAKAAGDLYVLEYSPTVQNGDEQDTEPPVRLKPSLSLKLK